MSKFTSSVVEQTSRIVVLHRVLELPPAQLNQYRVLFLSLFQNIYFAWI